MNKLVKWILRIWFIGKMLLVWPMFLVCWAIEYFAKDRLRAEIVVDYILKNWLEWIGSLLFYILVYLIIF